MNGVLGDLRVVEHSAFVAAPLAGMSLAQLGAEVIRIDEIDGPKDYGRWPVTQAGNSLYWAGLNKGKRSILIDLRSPKGQELATELVVRDAPRGGILLTNLGARGWASYKSLSQRRRDVILASLSGHPDGTAAVDYTVNCATGLPYLNAGASAAAPVNGVLPAWDITTGLTLAMGILAADQHRRLTGTGQEIKLALSDVAFAMMGNLGFIGDAQINANLRQSDGNHVYGTFARDFGTRDGHRVMVTSFTPRHWDMLCKACNMEASIADLERRLGLDLGNEGQRYAAREDIAALVAAWTESHTMEEVRKAFDAAGVCWGEYQDYRQMATQDPRCSPANPMFRRVAQPGIGELTVPGSPLNFSGAERTAFVAPRAGEHTDAILAEVIGLSSGKIGELHDRRIVGGLMHNSEGKTS